MIAGEASVARQAIPLLDARAMDPVRVGRSLRALRVRRGWTQERTGAAAGVSRETVSRVELGEAGSLRVDTLVRIAGALGAHVDVALRWRGEALDRLLDAAHAALVERTVEMLAEGGWETAVEVTFARYGERGSIDVLARHPGSGSLLVIEVKSVIPDMQAMLAALDRKARLARFVAAERGWPPASEVARLLVLPAGRTVRRRLADHRATLAVALPDRGPTVGAWLRRPTPRPFAGILLLPDRGGATERPGLPQSQPGSDPSGRPPARVP